MPTVGLKVIGQSEVESSQLVFRLWVFGVSSFQFRVGAVRVMFVDDIPHESVV